MAEREVTYHATKNPAFKVNPAKPLSTSPSLTNTLGTKGVGEAGCIGVPAAIMNAARDALSPLGEVDLQLPLRAEQLWLALQAKTSGDQT